jgi:DNA-binding CsgD family transcriptional regulator
VQTDAFDQLSERQRACLRLVVLHYDSKQIARQLNLSPHTVNKYLEDASKRLGTMDRFAAARRLAEWEHGPDYERIVVEQIGLEQAAQERAKMAASSMNPRASAHAGHVARDYAPPRMPFHMAGHGFAEDYFGDAGRNALTKSNRLKLVGIYVLGFLVAIALMSNIADTLWRTLERALIH